MRKSLWCSQAIAHCAQCEHTIVAPPTQIYCRTHFVASYPWLKSEIDEVAGIASAVGSAIESALEETAQEAADIGQGIENAAEGIANEAEDIWDGAESLASDACKTCTACQHDMISLD